MADAFDNAWSVVKNDIDDLNDALSHRTKDGEYDALGHALSQARRTSDRKPLPEVFSQKKLLRTGSTAAEADKYGDDVRGFVEEGMEVMPAGMGVARHLDGIKGKDLMAAYTRRYG